MNNKLTLVISVFFILVGCDQSKNASDTSTKALPAESTVNKSASSFDVVINNGRVIDPETKFDAVRNVGIKDGKIISITESTITGTKTIDATGHVVAPGFIDTHNHGAVTPHGGKLSLRNGVTSAMDLEVGAVHIDEWYAERKSKWQLNYGTTISQEFSRGIVLDGYDPNKLRDMRDSSTFRAKTVKNTGAKWSTHISTVNEMNQIFTLLDEGLMQGAIGIGSLLGYGSKGITTREMFETQKVAANYGRLTAVHVRYLETAPPKENAMAGAEVLWNAFLLDAPLLYCHFNADNWPLVQEMLVRARNKGMNVWGEIYPYTSGSSPISSDFWEPTQWKKTFGGFNDNILNPQTGKYLSEKEVVQLRKDNPGLMVVGFIRPKEWLVPWLKLPGVTLAGDAMLPVNSKGKELNWHAPFEQGAYHPRTSGTYAKALRLARENKIPLMHMISIASYNSAKHLGDTGLAAMKVRGRLQEGMVADIAVINPTTVRENSDYASGKNGIPSSGIPYVLVNGIVVVENSKVLEGVNPGQEIRFPVMTKNKFKTLKNEGDWVTNAKYPH